MKNLTLFFILIASIGFSQTTTLTTLNQESLSYLPSSCDSITLNIAPSGLDTVNTADINYSFTGTNLLGVSYSVTVTWGDNTTSTHTGSSVSNNTAIVWTPALIHNLSYTGTDALDIELNEAISGDSLAIYTIYYSNVCENIYFTSNIDCDNNGTIDSSQSYIYATDLFLYSATDTVYAVAQVSDSLFGFPNILPGTYNIGYTTSYQIASITPSTITFPLTGPIPNATAILNCPYLSCFSGTAFCDDNNNGIYDSLTESPVQNMPISSSVTDTNGFYSVTIGNTYPFTFGHFLPISTTWLTANGYYSANNYYIVDTSYLDSNCNNNPSFNIPIHCNLTNTDSVCFNGVLFHDLNHTGLYDTGDTTENNTAITLTVDGISQIIYADANGNFSYTGVHIGANNVSLSISQSWLNYYGLTTYGPIIVQNFNCDSTNITNIPLSDPSFNSISSIIIGWQNNYFVCDTVTLAISPDGLDTTVTEDLNIYFTGTNILNELYSLQINWGDNTSTTHTGTATVANQSIVWTPSLTHIYAVDSIYNITLDLTKISNQNSLTKNISGINSALCPDYILNISNLVDCDGDGTPESSIYNVNQYPGFGYYYYFHYSSYYLYNATDTIFADSCDNYLGNVYWPNSVPSGTYSLGILQSALDSIDMSWSASSPSTITIPNNGPVQSITNTFNCVQNQVCLNGYVFCDDNNNGVLDLGENTISDVPLNLSGNIFYSGTVNDNDTTDLNGYYNFPATIYDSAYFTFDVDQTWLTANGYIISNSTFYFDFPSYNNSDSIFDCATNFNIPVICNAAASDSICVNGQVFCDLNGDGILDTNETAIPNAPITLTLNNGGTFTTFADSLGNYTYHNYHPNTDSVAVSVPTYWMTTNGYTLISPLTVTTLDCSVNTNIGIDCNIPIPCDNTWINMFGVGPYYQNWTNTMALVFGNSDYLFPGSIYTISIVVPSGSELDTASFSVNNYTISGDTVSWTQTINNFDSLSINFNTDAGIPDSTLHTYQAFISGPNLDCDSTNNTISYTSVVGSSYDPNNKLVNLPLYINPAIQEELYYTINFQNTGTAPAQDVFIEDQLSQYLDWSSFEVVSKSHNMFYSVDASGLLVLTFPQIWLPDSTSNEPLSKGYVAFKIKESLTVPLNQPIENTAYIYFDLNPAIVTNTTININTSLGINSGNSIDLKLYPNPTSGLILIESSEIIGEITVYDLSGKRVYFQNNSDVQLQIDLSDLNKGMYLIKVSTDNSIINRRVILK